LRRPRGRRGSGAPEVGTEGSHEAVPPGPDPAPMRILVFNWLDRKNPQAGGAEIHLHQVFGRLARRGHRITLVSSGFTGGASRDTLDGIEVRRIGGRYTYAAAAPFFYRRALRSRPFDVVVEDLNKVPLFTPAWIPPPTVLLVHHLFGATAFREASPPLALATWLLERPIPTVYRSVPTIAISPSTAEDLVSRGLPPERITVIPNGIDTGRFRPDPAVPRFEKPTLLYLGRLKAYKRVDLVLRALARLRQRGCEARLVIAGRGDREEELRALARRLGAEHAVRFAGYVDEDRKLELLRRSWIHVLTSTKEGWGITNVEAAACGTPTVASDRPGLRDSVRHGETGLLVPHGDLSALSDTLARLLADPGERERMGRAARRFAETFTWKEAAHRIETHLAARVAEAERLP